VGVDDHDGAEPLSPQVGHELLGIREPLRVPGEGPVALLVVDVEPDRVGWDLPLRKFSAMKRTFDSGGSCSGAVAEPSAAAAACGR
jgi:hypothetical protein